jgi:hypothetical protein
MNDHEPSAPPTEPVALRKVQLAAVWPTLLGVLSMVLGVVGLIYAAMTMASPLMMMLFEHIPHAGQEETVRVLRKWTPWIVPSGAVCAVLAILLIIAGLGLAMRRPWGVRLTRIWAIAKVLWIPVYSGVSLVMQLEQARAAKFQMNQQSMPVPMGSAMESITYLTAFASFLWFIALPVFCLIWLRSTAAKREISAWEPRRHASPTPTP